MAWPWSGWTVCGELNCSIMPSSQVMHAGHAHVHLGASLTCRVLLPAHDLHAQCDVASGRVGELGQWASGGRRAARLDASGALGAHGRHSAQRRLAAVQVRTGHGTRCSGLRQDVLQFRKPSDCSWFGIDSPSDLISVDSVVGNIMEDGDCIGAHCSGRTAGNKAGKVGSVWSSDK